MAQSPELPMVLRVHRFGTQPLHRYSLMPRAHQGHPLDELQPNQLYEGIRGAVFAGRLARTDLAELTGDEEHLAAKDYLLSQVRVQLLAVELVKRAMPGANIMVRDMEWLKAIEQAEFKP